MKPVTVFCPYCNYRARFSPSSSHIYNGRDFGPVYECPKACDAYVSAHRDTLQPMGRLANKALRALKMQTHQAFDPLHRDLAEAYPDMNGVYPGNVQRAARARAYWWLAERMGIDRLVCHIAAFDDDQCRDVIRLIERERPTSKTIRDWAKARQETT